MFFRARLTKDLVLSPRDMGRHLGVMIEERLREAVQGKILGDVGEIVAVLRIFDDWKGAGKLDDVTGAAWYRVSYEALVFRLFKNEYCDAVVKVVTHNGIFAELGAGMKIFVHRDQLPEEMKEFSADAWISEDKTTTLKRDSGIRFKVLGVKLETSSHSIAATMLDPFCGLLS